MQPMQAHLTFFRNDPSREAALIQLWLSALGFPNTEKVFQEECTAAKLLDLDGLQHASKAKGDRPIILSMESLLAVSLSAQYPHQATGTAAPFQHANLANGLLQTTPPGFESPRNSASSKRKRQADAEAEASSSLDSSSNEDGSSSSSSTSGSEKVPKSQNDNQQGGAATIHAAPHTAEPTSPSGNVQASPETKKRKLMDLQLQSSGPAVLTSPGAQQSSKPKQSAPSSGPRGRGLHVPKEILHTDPSPLAHSPKELSPVDDATLKPSPAADSKPKVQPTDRARADSIPRILSLDRKKSPAKELPANKVRAASRRRSGDRRPESKAPVKAKTLCRYYARGMCGKGSSCEWSHDFRHRSSPLTEQDLRSSLERERDREEHLWQEREREDRARGGRRSAEYLPEARDKRDHYEEHWLRRSRSSEEALLRERERDAEDRLREERYRKRLYGERHPSAARLVR